MIPKIEHYFAEVFRGVTLTLAPVGFFPAARKGRHASPVLLLLLILKLTELEIASSCAMGSGNPSKKYLTFFTLVPPNL